MDDEHSGAKAHQVASFPGRTPAEEQSQGDAVRGGLLFLCDGPLMVERQSRVELLMELSASLQNEVMVRPRGRSGGPNQATGDRASILIQGS